MTRDLILGWLMLNRVQHDSMMQNGRSDGSPICPAGHSMSCPCESDGIVSAWRPGI